MGDPLAPFKPPAPQAAQFLASKLHDFAEKYAASHKLPTPAASASEDMFPSGKKIKIETESPEHAEDSLDAPDHIKHAEKEAKEGDRSTDMDLDPTAQHSFSAFVLNPDLEDMEEDSSSDISEDGSDL